MGRQEEGHVSKRAPVRLLPAIAGMLSLIALTPSWGQIEPAPPTTKFGPPSPDRFMGQVPANLQPPSPDKHDLNGMYVPDLAYAFRNAAPPPKPPEAPGGTVALESTAQMLCRPEVQIGSHDYGEQFIQTPGRLTIIIENNHVVRRIFIDAKFPRDLKPTYEGYSVGHWDGDTLVIETRALKAPELAQGANLRSIDRMTERLRKIEGNQIIEDVATLEGTGPDGGPAQRTVSNRVRWRPDLHLQEFICEDGAGRFFVP
jgi:hypothetical protein